MSPPLLSALRVRIRAHEWTGFSQTEGERRRKPPEQGGGKMPGSCGSELALEQLMGRWVGGGDP